MHPMTYNQHFKEARSLIDRAADLNQGSDHDRSIAQIHVGRAHVHAVIGAALLTAAVQGARNTTRDGGAFVDIPGGAQ